MRNNRNFATTQTLLGALLVICALIFYYFAVLRIDYQKTALLDLRPYPDATEYFAQAKALVKDRWPSIQIGYDKLPSRYPPGYPALMLPWLKILSRAHCRFGPISDESDDRAASAFDRVYLLRISCDAIDGWVCDALTRHASRLLHFLPIVT